MSEDKQRVLIDIVVSVDLFEHGSLGNCCRHRALVMDTLRIGCNVADKNLKKLKLMIFK